MAANPFGFGGLSNFYTQPFGQGTLGRAYYEKEPRAAYGQALGLGFNVTPQSRFLRGLFPEVYESYQGEIPLRGPEYGFLDFLQERTPQIQQTFQHLAPQLRGGTNPAGRVRYLF